MFRLPFCGVWECLVLFEVFAMWKTVYLVGLNLHEEEIE